jgi:hypothetical protein
MDGKTLEIMEDQAVDQLRHLYKSGWIKDKLLLIDCLEDNKSKYIKQWDWFR